MSVVLGWLNKGIGWQWLLGIDKACNAFNFNRVNAVLRIKEKCLHHVRLCLLVEVSKLQLVIHLGINGYLGDECATITKQWNNLPCLHRINAGRDVTLVSVEVSYPCANTERKDRADELCLLINKVRDSAL